MRIIKATEALELLIQAKELKPEGDDFVYRNPEGNAGSWCVNIHKTDDGTYVSGCIVGSVVVDILGVDPELIARHGEEDVSANRLAYALEGWGIATFSERAAVVLGRAQVTQDRGRSWGEAIEVAREYVGDEEYSDNV